MSLWIALDAGATNLRVAAVARGRLLLPVWQRPFGERDRVETAIEAIQAVARQHCIAAPYRLALAWAGAPNAAATGIVRARYGPALPDLVARLEAALPLAHSPRLHSDARAALQGGIEDETSAYALICGTGLGEAWYSEGRCWSREEFLQRFGAAAEWSWEGRDAESWLRASAWRECQQPPLPALQALVRHRLAQAPAPPQVLLLGGRFREWQPRQWLPASLLGLPLRLLAEESALLGAPRLEQARLASSPS